MKTDRLSKDFSLRTKKTKFTCQSSFLFFFVPPPPLYITFRLLHWSHMRWSMTGAYLIWYSVRPTWLDLFALLNEDKLGHDDLRAINRLPRRLVSRARRLVIVWLFGPIRARLTFCGYPHVSMPSSSMLIAATGRCRCLQIWLEFRTLKQSQSQRSWRSFPLHISMLRLTPFEWTRVV